jgi:hypothetical protein
MCLKKTNPWTGPEGSKRLRLPEFQDSCYLKVVKFRQPYAQANLPPGNISVTHCCYRVGRTQGRSADGKIKSMKQSNYTMGNKTRDLPACRAVPQPTTSPQHI